MRLLAARLVQIQQETLSQENKVESRSSPGIFLWPLCINTGSHILHTDAYTHIDTHTDTDTYTH